MEDDQVVSLTVAVPPQPEAVVVVDAELLTRISEYSTQAKNMSVIASDVENEAAAALLKAVTVLEGEVESNRKAINAPFHTISKAIGEAAAKATKPLASIKQDLKVSITQFIVKRDRERAEAEVAAASARRAQEQAEAAKRNAEQAEVDKLNASRVAEAAALNAPLPTPIILPAAPQVSVGIIAKPPAAKADAVKTTRKMVCRILDAGAVPRAYCIPDLSMIESAWKRGEITPELHTFFTVEEVVSVSAK